MKLGLTKAAVLLAVLLLFLQRPGYAQRGGRGAGPPSTPRAAAPVTSPANGCRSLPRTGAIVNSRRRGDFAALALPPAARKIAAGWDPASDEAAGEQCKAYGAAGVMRLPTRIRIAWEDDTRSLETDAGRQTRTFTSARRREATATGKESRQPRGTPRGPLSPVAVLDRRPADRSKSSPHDEAGLPSQHGVPYGAKQC